MKNKEKKPSVCCGVLERLKTIGWFRMEDGSKCMPYIWGSSPENIEIRYRVNNCPSCGAYVRDIIIYP